MQCPICNLDLSPLDLVSRTEHVDLCIENGPSIVEVGDGGQLIVKKNVHPSKQRKICPICDKTFQNLNTHFKTCALKHDVPPGLMLEHWDKINSDTKNPKKFPRDLLQNYVNKCVKENRLGEQVDFARALALSMSEGEPSNDGFAQTLAIETNSETSIDSIAQTVQSVPPQSIPASAEQILMRAATSRSVVKKRYRLELVDDATKQANIELRIDRELAVTNSARYREALKAEEELKRATAASDEDDEVIILDSDEVKDTSEQDNLFYRARLKACNGSQDCLLAKCQDHELMLMMDEFRLYSGASMDAAPTDKQQFGAEWVQAACDQGAEAAAAATTTTTTESDSSESAS